MQTRAVLHVVCGNNKVGNNKVDNKEVFMVNKFKSWLIICVMGVIALGSTGSLAFSINCPDLSEFPLNGCNLPGTIDGSFPYFDQTVSVFYKDKDTEDDIFNITGRTLKGSLRRWLQIDDETTDVIPKMKIKLDVEVDGTVASGDLKISGKIPNLGEFKVSADLEGEWDASDDGTFWGFNITNIACSGALESLVDCATDGVIYLNLLETIGPDTGANKIMTSGLALTSVTVPIPVPATAWLFCSGLFGLVGISRHRRNKP
jgi:hypothetical protein